MYSKPAIIDTRSEYVLPVVQITEHLTPEDMELVIAIDQYPPLSSFKPGDHAMLKRVPPNLAVCCEEVPAAWEIRFVISRWAYEAFYIVHSYSANGIELGGIDHMFNIMDVESELNEAEYQLPIIYAHGWPHGRYPNTAAWFWNPKYLKKIHLRDHTQEWEHLLDEFKTPYFGYEESELPTNFVFELAPDRYSAGMNFGGPLTHEEATFHTACLLGLEERLMVPIHKVDFDRLIIDPEHDAFEEE